MADSIGSLFGDGTDESQLQENIKLNEKGSPACTVPHYEDAEDEGAFEPVPELAAEEAFLPVPVASMNSFDPASMVSVHLTPKARIEPKLQVAKKVKEHEDENKTDAYSTIGQFSRALEMLRGIAVDGNDSNTNTINNDDGNQKRRKTGE